MFYNLLHISEFFIQISEQFDFVSDLISHYLQRITIKLSSCIQLYAYI